MKTLPEHSLHPIDHGLPPTLSMVRSVVDKANNWPLICMLAWG